MYQLVLIGNGQPFLINMRMLALETVRGERAPVHDEIRVWRDVILGFSQLCILVYD